MSRYAWLRAYNVTTGTIYKIGIIYNTVIGSIGVEIFVLLSGIGLYFSLSQNDNLKSFYRKRLNRILFPSVSIMLLYWIIQDFIIHNCTVVDFIKDFFFITFFTDGDRIFWYVLFIICAYAVYPLIFKMLNATGTKREINIVLLLCLTIAIQYVPRLISAELYSNIEIMLCRFLPLAVGAVLGKNIYEKKKIGLLGYVVLLIGLLLFLLERIDIVANVFGKIGWRNINCFYGLSLLFVSSIFLALVKLYKLKQIFSFLGLYSFEIYLAHVAVRDIFNSCDLHTYYVQNYIICLAISGILVLCIIQFKKKVLINAQ